VSIRAAWAGSLAGWLWWRPLSVPAA